MKIHPQGTNSLVPEGEYDGRLALTKEVESKNGTPMLLAEFEVYGAGGSGDGDAGRVTLFLLDGGFREKWESFLVAVASPDMLASYRTQRELDVDPNLWVGAKVRLRVVHETIKGKLAATVAELGPRESSHPLDFDVELPF